MSASLTPFNWSTV